MQDLLLIYIFDPDHIQGSCSREICVTKWIMVEILEERHEFFPHRDVQFSVHKAGLFGEFGPRNVSPQMSPLQVLI